MIWFSYPYMRSWPIRYQSSAWLQEQRDVHLAKMAKVETLIRLANLPKRVPPHLLRPTSAKEHSCFEEGPTFPQIMQEIP
jgi:hypothetical protein